MTVQNEKCVILLDGSLPPGVAANTAAILGVTLGARRPELVGQTAVSREGREHPGIIQFPVPVLRGERELIKELRRRLFQPEFAGLLAVDFSETAQSCRGYGEYLEKMAETGEEELEYLGLAICGDKKKVNRLTGSLPLL